MKPLPSPLPCPFCGARESLLVAALRSVRAWQRDAIMAWATAPNSEVRQDRWRECQVARATLERLMDGAV